MRLYNTMTRRKDEFVPMDGQEVKMYACGPTVYNYFHIGNARPFIVFDTMRRYFEYKGWKVKFVQNFTDIDDKMIRRAAEDGITVAQLAERFIKEYYVDAQGLGVRVATVHPRATEHIDEIIDIVKTLLEKGYAYESNGDVYYRTAKFARYGCLSGQSMEDLEAGSRVGVNEVKEDPMDFALWKAQKPGEPAWESPWGMGRPGWHIECSAMARRHLGNTIDIHGGGQDLVFPHHENEIAQSEAANGCQFARFWVHNGFINVDNEKMSKSLGNFFTVRDVAKVYGYEPIRFFMLSSQYRSPINYSVETLDQAKAALERLYTCRDHLDFLLANTDYPAEENLAGQKAAIDRCRDQFVEWMEDDLNTGSAMGALFELVKLINTLENPSKELLSYAKQCFTELTGVLGLLYARKEESIDSEVEALIEQRQQARASKDFKKADAIRDELKQKGIVLEDTKEGVKWRKEN